MMIHKKGTSTATVQKNEKKGRNSTKPMNE